MNEYEYLLLCLARYTANHPRPRYFASRLAEKHGKEFVERLRQLLKEHGK